MRFRAFFAGVGITFFATAPLLHAEQAWPSKPIRVIVGYSAGGNADIYARQLGEHMSRTLGQPVVIENKPGATGVLATKYVAESKPDGYTLLFASNSSLSAMPALRAATGGSLGYRVPEDFTFIGLAFEAPAGIFVHGDSKINNAVDLIAASKTGDVKIGLPGAGGASELIMEVINARTGSKLIGVPYQGVNNALTDIVSGRVDGFLGNFGTLKPMIDSGKLKLVVLFSDRRSPTYPDIKTFKEQGIDIVGTGLFGMVAPAGMPVGIVKKISAAMSLAIKDPAVAASVIATGVDVKDLPGDGFRDYVINEMRWYAQGIKSVPGIEKRLAP
ncbi:Argininosuccinate lyase [Variovorax sp. PBL-H6]|uniref:Bug family tripartite tricarboxylate transporter substrate binding protein n=1 Tax=Variovorax sp. PBL-H6 TaxID=434009 RepID=UPI001315BC95|nr:tripartite tricarboxylate transporter substrate binding protein [Variovorax sp. PBL-H6]VTU33485.1 Argininosuccinate lyase [Variovorax sp. PBL-H6]